MSHRTNLQARRRRFYLRLQYFERKAEEYRATIAEIEAELRKELLFLAPIAPRQKRQAFARGELQRRALGIMRAAGEPLSARTIALRALAEKGITRPDRRTVNITRKRLQGTFVDWQRRGVTVRIGNYRESLRALAGGCARFAGGGQGEI